MADKTTDIVVSQERQVADFITQAIASNAPVETMERLFDLRAKVKAEIAKEQFTVALGKFQSECPAVKKTKKVLNKDGRSTRYQYAPLDAIVEQIRKKLAETKLSYSWDVKHADGHMVVTCKITHMLGHSDTSSIEIPIDKEGFMTAPQKYASAQTFAKRYTLINALGISTGDEDTDATDVGREPTAKDPKAKILFLLRQLKEKTATKADVQKAVKKHTSLDLDEKNYPDIVERLEIVVKENQEV